MLIVPTALPRSGALMPSRLLLAALVMLSAVVVAADPVREPDLPDGTDAAARRLERVLTNDPGLGVVRHADAGYPEAIATARREGLRIPMAGAED